MSVEMLIIIAIVIMVCFTVAALLTLYVVTLVAGHKTPVTLAKALSRVFADLSRLLKIILPWDLLKALVCQHGRDSGPDDDPSDPTPIQVRRQLPQQADAEEPVEDEDQDGQRAA